MDKFKAICKQYSGVDIDIDKTFEETGVDSLDVVELIMAMEEAYGITIPDERAEHLTSYRNLFDLICEPKNSFYVGQKLISKETGEKYQVTAIAKHGYELTRIVTISKEECSNWSEIK